MAHPTTFEAFNKRYPNWSFMCSLRADQLISREAWLVATNRRPLPGKPRWFEHFYLSIQAAVAGLGVAIWPRPLVLDDLQSGRLTAPFGFIPSGFGYYLLSQRPFFTDIRRMALLKWPGSNNIYLGEVSSALSESNTIRIGTNQTSAYLAKARKALKLPADCVIHSLRHIALTRLGESRCDAFTIMRIAGHSSITVSQHYVHPSPTFSA